MARVFSSGFELNSVVDGVEFITNGTVGTTIDSTTKRTGGYSMKIDLSSGSRSGAVHQYAAAASTGPWWARCYFYFTTLPTGATRVMSFKSGGNALTSADRVYITVDNTGTIILYDEDGSIATHGTTVTTNTWYRFELNYDTTGAAGAHVAKFRLDGSEIGSSTRSISTSPLSVAFGGNFNAETVTGTYYLDDIALNSSAAGGTQTSWPGSGSLAIVWPNAAGDTANGARGGTDSGTDYGQVNSYNDASYYVLDVDADIIDFNVTSATDAGIGSTDTVILVQVGQRVRDAASSGASATRSRIKSQASGTVANGTALGDLGTTFLSNGTAAPFNYLLTQYTDPQSGSAWTAALINTMQIGWQATDAAPDAWIAALWAYVEFNARPTVALNSPADASSDSDTTPDLTFTGTDTQKDDIRYNLQLHTAAFSDPAVRASSKNDDPSGTAVSVSAPTGTTTGDFVVVVVHCNANTTIADNNGGTPFTEDLTDWSPNTNGQTLAIFSRTIQGGDPSTYNFTIGTSGRWSAIAVTFNGAHSYNVAPTTGQGNYSDVSDDGTISVVALTPTTTSTIQVSIGGWDTGAYGTITPPSGYTLLQTANTDGQPLSVSYLAKSAQTTYSSHNHANNEVCPRISMSFTVKRAILTDVVSGTDAGFAGSPDNSDPFASAQAVTYTVQSALAETTHYWRVRGIDPSGTNAYGDWTSARTFTVTAGGATSVKDIIGMGMIPFAR